MFTSRIIRLTAALLSLPPCVACNSTSNATPANPPGVTCSVGTQVALSNPLSGATGVPGNIGSIQIVVDANTDLLGSSWNTLLVDQFGNHSRGGTLTLTTNHGGYAPFPNNYYYNSSVGQLATSDVWNIYMNQFTSQCTPAFIGW